MSTVPLSMLDENKACYSALRRLVATTNTFSSSKSQKSKSILPPKEEEEASVGGAIKVPPSSLLLHKWTNSARSIPSNLELTRCLRQLQPLLEETVQKKYTTSRMWDSFQGGISYLK